MHYLGLKPMAIGGLALRLAPLLELPGLEPPLPLRFLLLFIKERADGPLLIDAARIFCTTILLASLPMRATPSFSMNAELNLLPDPSPIPYLNLLIAFPTVIME